MKIYYKGYLIGDKTMPKKIIESNKRLIDKLLIEKKYETTKRSN